jgi:hypothetical protein
VSELAFGLRPIDLGRGSWLETVHTGLNRVAKSILKKDELKGSLVSINGTDGQPSRLHTGPPQALTKLKRVPTFRAVLPNTTSPAYIHYRYPK